MSHLEIALLKFAKANPLPMQWCGFRVDTEHPLPDHPTWMLCAQPPPVQIPFVHTTSAPCQCPNKGECADRERDFNQQITTH